MHGISSSSQTDRMKISLNGTISASSDNDIITKSSTGITTREYSINSNSTSALNSITFGFSEGGSVDILSVKIYYK